MIILGNKYIIEVEEVYHGENHPNSLELYRVKGFNTLVFDHYGLNKLERLDEHDDALITKLAKNYYTKDDFDRESKDAYERGYADCMAENDFDKPCASCPDSRKHGKWERDVYTAGGVLELLVKLMKEYNLYSKSEANHTFSPSEPKTNADRIRAMTDEELADWLGVYCNGQTAQEVGKPCVSGVGSCEECWLDWLKQECES